MRNYFLEQKFLTEWKKSLIYRGYSKVYTRYAQQHANSRLTLPLPSRYAPRPSSSDWQARSDKAGGEMAYTCIPKASTRSIKMDCI